jgi:hypothetical protein
VNNLLLFNALGCAHGYCDVFLLMEKVNRFDDQETLTIPVNQVLAIIMDLEEVEGIVQILNQNGFSSEEIGVLTGIEDAEKLGSADGEQGFFSKLLTAGVEMGDRDTGYLKQYRRALLNGRTVIGVVAKDDEARNNVRKILKARGARFITFFGRFVTEILEA